MLKEYEISQNITLTMYNILETLACTSKAPVYKVERTVKCYIFTVYIYVEYRPDLQDNCQYVHRHN